MARGFRISGLTSGAISQPRLRGVTCDIAETGITAVVGPSGSGKSSLLRQLNRLDSPSGGSVCWRGTDLGGFDPADVQAHRREVGMVFQRPVLGPGSVADNMRIAAAGLDDAGIARQLERVALDATFAERPAAELSGGEQQRVCLARTLATDPVLVLADEPTASLDPESTAVIEALVHELAIAAEPVGWVWVTHDHAQADRLSDATITMQNGRNNG